MLGMLEAQPQWVRSKPHRWEDLRVPLEAEIKKESETYTKLKQLPENLKHVFLDSEKNCPIIISSRLQEKEKEKLVQVLKKYKSVMGWIIGNLKGISPTLCMHKILMEDDHKPMVQPQRRLNPTMKGVVRK